MSLNDTVPICIDFHENPLQYVLLLLPVQHAQHKLRKLYRIIVVLVHPLEDRVCALPCFFLCDLIGFYQTFCQLISLDDAVIVYVKLTELISELKLIF